MPAPKMSRTKPEQALAVPDALLDRPVPHFALPSSAGGTVTAQALRGKPFVLYFYPKDDTSGCTLEACGFRDALPDFAALGTQVFGVSKDGLPSHAKFITKHALTFPLLSDADGAACEAFGVWVEKSMYGKKYMGIERATFLVDAKGIVRAVWRKVSVPQHVAAVQAAVTALAS
jgi:thioredoxin-dependent peroxiredoxin